MEETRQYSALMVNRTRTKVRLRGFMIHLFVYFAISTTAFLINVTSDQIAAWFVVPVVGWGSILALHVAYVMGLFEIFFNKQWRE